MASKRRVSKFEYRGDVEVSLVEDFENDSANGTRLWEAGMLLSRYVEAKMRDKMRGRRVLELGAGTGLLGLYLACIKADVLMVDYNDLVVKLLRENVKENKSSAKVAKFDWCDEVAVQELVKGKPFDYIMGADCVYTLDATQGLVKCLLALCSANPTTLIFMSIETRDDAVTKFFVDQMEAANFEVTITSQKGVDAQYQHEDVHLYRCQRK